MLPLKFQSTLPARGSDLGLEYRAENGQAISIHAPREGERLQKIFNDNAQLIISIHAPREGERRLPVLYAIPLSDFNPRSPRGGATNC